MSLDSQVLVRQPRKVWTEVSPG